MFGFLHGLPVPLIRLKLTSRKETSLRFVLISIFKPKLLNILMMIFLSLSVCWSFKLFTTIKLSSLYNSTSFCLRSFVRCDNMNIPPSSHSSAPSWLPIVTSKQDSDLFFHVSPKNNKLQKIFNHKSVKISYSCTENISQIISSRNKNILRPNKNQELPCKYRQKENCPMQGKCRKKNVLFKFIASTPTKLQRVYIGISDDGKSGITITRNHPKANAIKLKHSSVVTFGKSRGRPDKYQQ